MTKEQEGPKEKGPTFQTKVIPFHFPFLIANNISTHK